MPSLFFIDWELPRERAYAYYLVGPGATGGC